VLEKLWSNPVSGVESLRPTMKTRKCAGARPGRLVPKGATRSARHQAPAKTEAALAKLEAALAKPEAALAKTEAALAKTEPGKVSIIATRKLARPNRRLIRP
jgi:multidrug resistance efflux pump